MKRILRAFLLLFLIPACACATLPDFPIVREIPWGSGTSRLGITFQDRGQLPEGPFMGPGGFRVDAEGGVWISDSVQKSVKRFAPDGGILSYPVKAAKLGDLFLLGTEVAVITGSPDGIAFIDRATGSETRRIETKGLLRGRLNIIDKDHILVGGNEGGVFLYMGTTWEMHPASALEPVGTADTLFGTLYEFDVTSRVIIRAAWTGEASDPEAFARYKLTGADEIVFSRLLGMSGGFPAFMLVTRADPAAYRIVRFDADGKVVSERKVPIFPGCPLPSPWIFGEDGALYAAEADDTSFRVRRAPALND